MKQTNANLKHYYRVANALYFANMLPDNIPMRFAVIPNIKGHKVWGRTNVLGDKAVVGIDINVELREAQSFTVMTVLHEMLHVEKPSCKGHDWRFDRRMRRLAMAGAFDGLW